MAKKKYVVKVA
jgi:hypothetical protein